MKNFVILLLSICILLFYLSYKNIFSKTRSGERQESFVSLSSNELPLILASYLASRSIRYEYYKIPNYVKDFLTDNIDYSAVYKASPKYTALVFAPVKSSDKNFAGFSIFYPKLLKELNFYGGNFRLLYKDNLSYDDLYKDPYDRVAFRDLREHCRNFCLVNPVNDTLFTFKNLTLSETDALEVLLQQYNFLLK